MVSTLINKDVLEPSYDVKFTIQNRNYVCTNLIILGTHHIKMLQLLPVHSVQFSHSIVSDSLQPHGLQQARPPCPSPIPGACSNSCPLSQQSHPNISSSVVPFSSCLQSFPASGSFQMSQFFASGGQKIGVEASTSVLPVNIQD